MANLIATGGYSVKNIFDGDPAKNYRLQVDNTAVVKDNLNLSVSPDGLTISSTEISGLGNPVPFLGYFKIYRRSNAGITMQDYDALHAQGLIVPESTYIIGQTSNLLVEVYRSEVAESTTIYDVEYATDTTGIYICLYRDPAMQVLLDLVTIPVTSDGTKVKTTTISYKLDDQGLIPPTSGWVGTIPTPVPGKYTWTKTVTLYDDGRESIAHAVSAHGVNGADGRSITNVDVEFASTTSNSVAPTAGWQTTAPAWVQGSYIWSRTKTTYSIGEPTYSAATCISGSAGSTGKGISQVKEQYNLSTSNTVANGTWQDTMPNFVSGSFIWTRMHITWTDTSTSTTLEVLANAINDANQRALNVETQAQLKAPFIESTHASSLAAWTGVAPFATLASGQQITYLLKQVPTGSATLNLTLAGGGSTGAINAYYGGATRLTTHYSQGSVIRLTYLENNIISGTPYTGWWADANYADGNNYDRIQYSRNITAKTAITAGWLIGSDVAGYFKLAAGTTIQIDKPILYAGSAIAAAAVGTNNYTVYSQLTLTSTFTIAGLAANDVIYLKGELNGLNFTLNATTPVTKAPTDDGSEYMILGQMYSATAISLYSNHDLYMFHDGVFKSFAQIAAETSVLSKSTADKVLDMADDNKLTPEEKIILKRELDGIVVEKTQIDGQASVYPLITTEKTNFNTAYTTLYNYLNPKLANLTTTEAVSGATLRSYFADYVAKRELLKKKITEHAVDAAKKYAADQAAAIAGQFAGVDVEFASGDSNSIIPATGWQTTAPAWVAGKYIWSRIKTIYSVGSPTYSVPVCISSTKEIGVSAIKEQYNLSTSSTAANGTWVDSMPTFVLGSYLWVRVHITWVDASITTSPEVLTNTILADRVIDVEMNVTAESIVSAVRASTLYKNDLDVLASKTEAEGYSEAAKVAAIAAAAEDALLKANTALNDAKIYADQSVTVLTERMTSAEQKITAEKITQVVTSSSTYQEHLAALEPTVFKQAIEPPHVLNRMWLDTSVTPNVMYRSDGVAWIKTTPTTADEIGAYAAADGASLEHNLNTAVGTLSTAVSDLEASITTTADAIRTEVSETYTKADEFGIYKGTVETKFAETKDAFLFDFNKLIQTVKEVDGKVVTNDEEIKKYIRFIDGKILLGGSDSAITLEISNNRISFLQTGNPDPVAYIDNNVLYITDGRFLTSLRVGNFAFTPNPDNGNLSFSKVV